ncbi:hypothetical protein DFS34DRAFT_636637 [Phlyctochytrium arcticum]|nr:hypothetical protein DFS34DRAFT_636637 [Phlyctochytrium arcticum]
MFEDPREEGLREASAQGNIEAVKQFLSSGVNPNTANKVNKWTPLHWAAKRGNVEIVRILMGYHADLELKNDRGQTAAMLAKDKEVRGLLNGEGAESDGGEEDQKEEGGGFVPAYLSNPTMGLFSVPKELQPGGDLAEVPVGQVPSSLTTTEPVEMSAQNEAAAAAVNQPSSPAPQETSPNLVDPIQDYKFPAAASINGTSTQRKQSGISTKKSQNLKSSAHHNNTKSLASSTSRESLRLTTPKPLSFAPMHHHHSSTSAGSVAAAHEQPSAITNGHPLTQPTAASSTPHSHNSTMLPPIPVYYHTRTDSPLPSLIPPTTPFAPSTLLGALPLPSTSRLGDLLPLSLANFDDLAPFKNNIRASYIPGGRPEYPFRVFRHDGVRALPLNLNQMGDLVAHHFCKDDVVILVPTP